MIEISDSCNIDEMWQLFFFFLLTGGRIVVLTEYKTEIVLSMENKFVYN